MPRRTHNIKRKFDGGCIDCGAPAEFGRVRCEGCLMRQRIRKKEQYGEKKRISDYASKKDHLKFSR